MVNVWNFFPSSVSFLAKRGTVCKEKATGPINIEEAGDNLFIVLVLEDVLKVRRIKRQPIKLKNESKEAPMNIAYIDNKFGDSIVVSNHLSHPFLSISKRHV